MEFHLISREKLLVLAIVIISSILQVIWLIQIFRSNERALKNELDAGLNNAAKNAIYNSLIQENYQGNPHRRLLLSPEWLKFRLAFDNLRVPGLTKSFSYFVNRDSARFTISILHVNFLPGHDPPKHQSLIKIDHSPEIFRAESFSQRYMNRAVDSLMRRFHIHSSYYYMLYNYRDYHLSDSSNRAIVTNPAFVSAFYSYNLAHIKKYRLFIPSLFSSVLFRMRFNIISSFIMLAMTVLVFYLILRLLETQRMYSEAKIALTSNITHELKTPLATVSLALEAIEKNKLIIESLALKDYVNIGRQELKRLTVLIDKLLNLGRSDETEILMFKEKYNIEDGIGQVIKMLQLKLDEKKVSLTLISSGLQQFVSADRIHLNGVFFNLIENSIKYGAKNITVTMDGINTDDWATITVSDDGPGIPAIYFDRVFDRFFRVPDKDNIHYIQGTGLGLYYARQVIESHDGTLILKKGNEIGVMFIIRLPLLEQ